MEAPPLTEDATAALDAGLPLRDTGTADSGTVLDVQIGQSPTIVLSIALALFILFVSTYTYQRIPELQTTEGTRSAVVALAGLFSALPAALVGGLAFRGQAFAARMSRGPRILVTALACITAMFAAMVSLRDVGLLTELTAYGTSIYCVVVVGILGHIQLGPRWRTSERSRRPKKTARASPDQCERWQHKHAYIFLGVWSVVTVLFARCQFALQDEHFLTRKFPGNIWRAIWSWFGL